MIDNMATIKLRCVHYPLPDRSLQPTGLRSREIWYHSTLALTDFSKAFDLIDHNIVFSNLRSTWLTSFLGGSRGSNTKSHFLNGKLYREEFHKVKSLSNYIFEHHQQCTIRRQKSNIPEWMIWPWVKARSTYSRSKSYDNSGDTQKVWTRCIRGHLRTSWSSIPKVR